MSVKSSSNCDVTLAIVLFSSNLKIMALAGVASAASYNIPMTKSTTPNKYLLLLHPIFIPFFFRLKIGRETVY